MPAARRIVYLACPYSHPDLDIRLERFAAANRAAAWLIRAGSIVYSPISMTHPIDLEMSEEGISQGSDYWCDFDEAFMEFCTEMLILDIPGWENSSGIARELRYFKEKGRDVSMLTLTNNVYETKRLTKTDAP